MLIRIRRRIMFHVFYKGPVISASVYSFDKCIRLSRVIDQTTGSLRDNLLHKIDPVCQDHSTRMQIVAKLSRAGDFIIVARG